jgi:multidrug efflux pump subunit AcrB
MWIIRNALRRPWTALVLVIAVALTSIQAFQKMRVDIFPNLNLPVIYIAQPYGGLSPKQMEGFVTYYYEYHFLYVNGIESVESKSIQGAALLKLTFHEGTDMSAALAQTIAYANRAHAFMPYGTVPPFIIRFDAGTVPVGYLTFTSTTRTLGEIQDLALNRVRPQFATLPGLTSPPPFGGNQRTIVVSVDAEKLRSYGISPDQVVQAVNYGNAIIPAGSVQAGKLQPIVPSNTVVNNIQDLASLPIRAGAGPAVFLRDVGRIDDSTDILAGYAEIDGKRAVYIPVTKRPDASTLTVVSEVRANLDRFRSLVPSDIQVDYRFDQSTYVKDALNSVLREGALGALLTGLMILLFLGYWRSSLIVVLTIPFSILTAIVLLWASRQTINIMTLGGLALAIGVLVDEGTVVLENIHTHLEQGAPKSRAILDASREVVVPRLLAMLAILAVFVPSFFMTGVARALFIPLSLAVGFAMFASYLLSGSMVPILSNWVLPTKWEKHENEHHPGRIERMRRWLRERLNRLLPYKGIVVVAYTVAALLILGLAGLQLGRELFPSSSNNLFRLSFHAPAGTRVAETEQLLLQTLNEIEKEAGNGNVSGSLGYLGLQGASYPINTVFLWTGGPQDAVFQIALNPNAKIDIAAFEERLRQKLSQQLPGCQFSFQGGDLVSQIMNFGSPTPVEIAVSGTDFDQIRVYAAHLKGELSGISSLRDVQYEEALDYPSINVNINRELAGQLGLTAKQVGNSLLTATSSSRFVSPNYWADPKTGVGYQVQVEIPQPQISSRQDIANVPANPSIGAHPLIGELAQVSDGSVVGEYDRRNGQRMIVLSANTYGQDLGRVAAKINEAIQTAGTLPRGARVEIRGQIAPMRETFQNLTFGLLVAALTILLLLTANFQSIRLALTVLSTAPAVLCGVVVMLLITGTTLNLQSFMGAIMALGVATANAILLVTFAERYRKEGQPAGEAAIHAAYTRMRPVLMTSLAMTAGMIPMAIAIGSGAEATAPLGRAVIGGLLAATLATLTILPMIFTIMQSNAKTTSLSLDPDDPESALQKESA